MKVWSVIILLLVSFGITSPGKCFPSLPHAPHDAAHGVTCASCHAYSLREELWPPDYPPTPVTPDDTFTTFICLRCHDGSADSPGEIAAPIGAMHSSLSINGNHLNWTVECIACHDPHFQGQLGNFPTRGDDIFLATGTIDIDGITDNGDTTTILYSQAIPPRSGWTNKADWGAKTAAGRGLILVVDKTNPKDTFEILAADAATITIAESLDPAAVDYPLSEGQEFGIIYGQFIRSQVRTPNNGQRAVTLFDPNGGYVDQNSDPLSGGFVDNSGSPPLEGICQVCHENTTYWQSDGSGTPHPIDLNEKCTDCHHHDAGFAGSCDTCHAYPPPTNAHTVHVTTIHYVCDECHFGNDHNPNNITSTPATFLNDYDRSLVDVGFDPTGFNSDANNGPELNTPSYNPDVSSDLGTCLNLTCHNPDNSFTGRGDGVSSGKKTNNLPAWGGSITTCQSGGCHADSRSATIEPDGGDHYSHEHPNTSYGPRMECRDCHAGVNIIDPEVVASDARHGNLARNIDQDNDYPVQLEASLPYKEITGIYTDGPAGTTSGSTCANIYCHGNSEFTSSTGSDKTFTWGSTSVSWCHACHANYLSWPGLDNKSHIAHTDTDYMGQTYFYGPGLGEGGCDCHGGTSDYHANGRVDISDSPDGSLANSTYCDHCHGTAAGIAEAKANWNSNITADRKRISNCLYCHNNVTPGNSRRDGLGVNAPAVPDFEITGHGNNTTFNVTNNTGPGLLCTTCHDDEASHINGALTDEDRLTIVPADGLGYTSAASELCLDCHGVGQTTSGSLGYDAAAEAAVHSGAIFDRHNTNNASAYPAYGDRDNYTSYPGYQCIDCHNPHGTAKLAMIRPVIDSRTGGVTNPVAVAGFESSDPDMTDLDPSVAANDGVCDVCHAAAGNAHPDTTHPGNHLQGNTGDACKACHDHRYSFVDQGPHIDINDSVDPASDLTVFFNYRVVNTIGTQTITLSNMGTENLTIGIIAEVNDNPATAPFSIINDTCSESAVAPRSSCIFEVQFAPTTINTFFDDFSIPTNDGDNPTVTFSLSGTGIAEGPDISVPDNISFARQFENTVTTQTVTIQNDGIQDLTIGLIGDTNMLEVPFYIQNDTCSGSTLAPSNPCTFEIRFESAVAGSFSADVDIPSNDLIKNPVTVTVTGDVDPINYAYIGHLFGGKISRVRVSDHMQLSKIDIGVMERISGLALSPDGSMLYAPHQNVNDNKYYLSKVRTSDLVTEKKLSFNTSPYTKVFPSRNSQYYYLIYAGSGAIYVRDSVTDLSVKTIVVGSNPLHLDESFDGQRLYVPLYGGSAVSVVNISSADPANWSEAVEVTVGVNPFAVAVTPDNNFVYVTNSGSSTVSVFSTATNIIAATIPVGNNPRGLAVTPDNAYVYVANYDDDTVSVISTASNSVLETILVNNMPQSIDLTPDGKYVYVVHTGGELALVNTLNNEVEQNIVLDSAYVQNINNFITTN